MMQRLFRFLLSTAGRWVRVIVGGAMIVYGLFFASSVLGYVVAAIGVIPLVTGSGDTCLFAPAIGLSREGAQARHALQHLPH